MRAQFAQLAFYLRAVRECQMRMALIEQVDPVDLSINCELDRGCLLLDECINGLCAVSGAIELRNELARYVACHLAGSPFENEESPFLRGSFQSRRGRGLQVYGLGLGIELGDEFAVRLDALRTGSWDSARRALGTRVPKEHQLSSFKTTLLDQMLTIF
jgi:hypothetical protein